MPGDRAKIAAVILQPPARRRCRSGSTRRIDYAVELARGDPGADGRTDTRRAARSTRPYNTRLTRVCRRRRSPTRGWPRSTPQPIPPTSPTCTTWPGPTAAASTCSPSRRPNSKPTRPPTGPRWPKNGGRPPCASTSEHAPRACWAGRWRTAARRRCRTPRWPQLGLHDWRYQLLPVPPELFAETVRALPGGRLSRSQRHDPPQGGGARAGERGERRGARDRGGQHAHLRSRAARSRPRTPTTCTRDTVFASVTSSCPLST